MLQLKSFASTRLALAAYEVSLNIAQLLENLIVAKIVTYIVTDLNMKSCSNSGNRQEMNLIA